VDLEEDYKVSNDLFKKMKEAFDKVRELDTTTDNDETDALGTYGQFTDVPYLNTDKPFKTHRSLEQTTEAEEPAIDPDAAAKEAETTEEPTGDSEGGIGDIGMDASGETPGVSDTGMAGMDTMGGMAGQQEEELTSSELGRIYELKKIYSRLTSVESFLSRTTDQEMLEIRKMVSQSINLFELVISNISQFKQNIDEIIVTYYEFLDKTYSSMKKYFSQEL
jgi:hypothetical protein